MQRSSRSSRNTEGPGLPSLSRVTASSWFRAAMEWRIATAVVPCFPIHLSALPVSRSRSLRWSLWFWLTAVGFRSIKRSHRCCDRDCQRHSRCRGTPGENYCAPLDPAHCRVGPRENPGGGGSDPEEFQKLRSLARGDFRDNFVRLTAAWTMAPVAEPGAQYAYSTFGLLRPWVRTRGRRSTSCSTSSCSHPPASEDRWIYKDVNATKSLRFSEPI